MAETIVERSSGVNTPSFGHGDRRHVLGLRVFEHDRGKMDKNVVDVGDALLVVSQLPLCGDVRRGMRPSFDDAMPPVEGSGPTTLSSRRRGSAFASRRGAFARTWQSTASTGAPSPLPRLRTALRRPTCFDGFGEAGVCPHEPLDSGVDCHLEAKKGSPRGLVEAREAEPTAS